MAEAKGTRTRHNRKGSPPKINWPPVIDRAAQIAQSHPISKRQMFHILAALLVVWSSPR